MQNRLSSKWCGTPISDQGLHSHCPTKPWNASIPLLETFAPRLYPIYIGSGPTTDRRKWRCKQQKQRHVNHVSKYFCVLLRNKQPVIWSNQSIPFSVLAIRLLQSIHLFALKALAADCSRWSSHVVVVAGFVMSLFFPMQLFAHCRQIFHKFLQQYAWTWKLFPRKICYLQTWHLIKWKFFAIPFFVLRFRTCGCCFIPFIPIPC